jgi:hypothetical protein
MEMEKVVKKAEGIQTNGGNGAGEEIELGWYSVLNAFDPDAELTGFIAGEAIEDCSEDYELLERFLKWKDQSGLENGKFKDINVDTLADVTTPFMNVGFAFGYLFGQIFKTDDAEAVAFLAELKRTLIEKGLWPFTAQWQERRSPSALATMPQSRQALVAVTGRGR